MRKFIVVGLVLLPFIVFSQTDFRKGYIVTLGGDTISGFVNYREGTKSYETCEFTLSNGSESKQYLPTDIRGYGIVEGRLHESKAISGENPVFFQVLVKGGASLYKHNETFWLEKDQEFIQLQNTQTETVVEGKRYYKSRNEHIAVLGMLLFDCEAVRPAIQKVPLYERQLTKLVERYNQCTGTTPVVAKAKKPWVKAQVSVAAGMDFSQVKFRIGDFVKYGHLQGKTEVATSMILGLMVDVLSPRLSEQFAITTGLLYVPVRYKQYNELERNLAVDYNHVTIELQQLKVPIGLRYVHRGQGLRPFANVGISGIYHVSSKSDWKQEIHQLGRVTYNEGKALPLDDTQFGLWAGIGAIKSINNVFDITLEVRGERTDGFVPLFHPSLRFDSYLDSKVRSTQVIFAVRWK